MSIKKRACSEETCPINQEKYNKYLRSLSRDSQNYKILKYMIENGSISSYEAFGHIKCTRLSARIHDLRALGIEINSVHVTKKNENGNYSTYVVYTLGGEEE